MKTLRPTAVCLRPCDDRTMATAHSPAEMTTATAHEQELYGALPTTPAEDSYAFAGALEIGEPQKLPLGRPRGQARPLLALLAGGLAVAGIATVSAIGRKRAGVGGALDASGLNSLESASPERGDSASDGGGGGGGGKKKKANEDMASSKPSPNEDASADLSTEAVLNISYRAYNSYTANMTQNPYRFLPWDSIAEPFRATTLEAVRTDATPTSADPSSEVYQWRVDDEVLEGWTGPSAEFSFTSTGFHTVEMKLIDGEGSVMAVSQGSGVLWS